MTATTAPVLIIGGGPVGLGAALELARCGIRSIVVEKHDSTSWHPKTRNFNTRTMEIARGWGPVAYQRFRSIDTPPGWKSPIRFFDTVTGTEYGRIESKGFEGPGRRISPAEPVMSSQELIEEIMLDAARASDLVDIRFSTEVVELVRGGADGDVDAAITVCSCDTGATETLVGPALVSADGASSFIRATLGLEMEGDKSLAQLVNCYFRADIEPHLRGRRGVLLFVAHDKGSGVLQPLDGRGRWLSQINVTPDEFSLDVYTPERAAEWVRASTGIADLHVEVLSLGLWQLNATVVERLVQGRVLLVGDAAHQFPPTGGLGVNTGLQGMHNAMWKLAWHLHGWADWALVETYHTERRPVAQRITRQSLENSFNVGRIRMAMTLGTDAPLSPDQLVVEARRYGNHLGVEFGENYTSAAVVDDGTTPPTVADDYSDYAPSATPGSRAPHHWLGSATSPTSTIDLIGTAFTLIAAHDGHAWIDAAHHAARATGVPIDTYRVDSAGLADHGDFAGAYGITTRGAVLIRPDGHIAWRSPDAPDDPATLVAVVRDITTASTVRHPEFRS